MAEFGAEKILLHGRWVRERCACAECVEPKSKQPKRSLSHPERRDERAETVVSSELVEEENEGNNNVVLRVEFADGHTTTLAAERVAAEIADFPRTGALINPTLGDASPPLRELWDRAGFSLPQFDHSAFQLHRSAERCDPDARVARRELLGALLKTGVAVVRGVPCFAGEIRRFARDLVGQVRDTHWGVVFDVKSAADAKSNIDEADQAYTSTTIDFHADNPYRVPVPDFQLLHCLEWVQQPGTEGEGVNLLVDAFACAERLRREDAEAFRLLATTPLKWEDAAPLSACEPVLQVSATDELQRVFWSPKSGGFAPPLPHDELARYYAAQDKFAELLESDEFVVQHKLSPGEMLLFCNTRVLHARTGFSQSAARHLQGLYIDYDAVTRTYATLALTDSSPTVSKPADGPQWSSLKECTEHDVKLMGKLYAEDKKSNRVQRVLDMLRAQRGQHCELGAPIDLFEHGLQTATRAHAAGESVDVVVAALLHDVGELLVPENHGDVAASLLAPYVEPAVTAMLKQHEIFQSQFYGEQLGLKVDVGALKTSEHYELTQRFCEEYDQASFDPLFQSRDVAFFTPMVEEVFGREPFWHTPDHPKRGLVTGE
jgi:gamma-butyrobetaine dioxygenase